MAGERPERLSRGEIWESSDVTAADGHALQSHPFMVLSWDAHLPRAWVTVAQVTSTIRQIDAEVVLGDEDGMDHDCVVNLDMIYSVKKEHLLEFGDYKTTLSAAKMAEVNVAIHHALKLDVPCRVVRIPQRHLRG